MAKISSEQKFVDYLRQYNIPLKSINFSESTYTFTSEEIKTINEIYYGTVLPPDHLGRKADVTPSSNKKSNNIISVADLPIVEDIKVNENLVVEQYIEFEAFNSKEIEPISNNANNNIETANSFSFNQKKIVPLVKPYINILPVKSKKGNRFLSLLIRTFILREN